VKPAPTISAVIPAHNRADLLARLLETALLQTVPFSEIIVVDNGSTDTAREVAARAGCRVIELGKNTGFAHAVNRGCATASGEWVAILNTDVELSPFWLEHLLESAGDAGAGAPGFASGTILDAADPAKLDGAYDLLSRGGCAWRVCHGEQAMPFFRSSPASIAIAPATACLFRRSVFEQLGGFSEEFGSYLEDVDLGLRCLRAGTGGVFVPRAMARHHGSATLGRWNPRVVRLISRNQLLLIARHYDRHLFLQCLWPILAGQLLWGVVALKHGAFLAWLGGKLDGLRNFRLNGEPSERLRNFLYESEREIRLRARDPYWRWYCRLTGSAGTNAAH
jgi:GT2 family glycosyltransferase